MVCRPLKTKRKAVEREREVFVCNCDIHRLTCDPESKKLNLRREPWI